MLIIKKNAILSYMTHYSAVLCIGFVQATPINQADIESGLTIDQSGSWQLVENITFTCQYGIIINAPDVTLDLQGYTIDGQETGQCALSVRADNCHILNGIIKATADTAITLENTIGTQVSKVTMQECQQGIQITNCQYSTIQDCIVQTPNTTGLIVTDSNYTTISGITVQGSKADGVLIEGSSDGSALAHAIVFGCTGTAISLSSNAISLTGLVIYKNGANGIVIAGNDIALTGLSCSLNGGNGLLISGQGALIQRAAIGANAQDGIHLSASSANTKIAGGISSGNTLIGINNLGATSNTAAHVDVRVNKVRNLWRIINSH
jgi:hypothetical protein